MAIAWMFGSSAVVICLRWTSLTRALGKQDEELDVLPSAKCLDGSRAGIAPEVAPRNRGAWRRSLFQRTFP